MLTRVNNTQRIYTGNASSKYVFYTLSVYYLFGCWKSYGMY